MGSCTSKKVANQVDTDAIVMKHEINHSAHQHLKNMLNDDPLASSMSSDALNATLKKMQRQSKEGEEAKVVDKDASAFEQDGGRLHEPLWQAIEAGDLTSATKFLNLNEIEEQNMYDANGQSMLHKCAQLGHSDMLMLLLERTGAKPDLVNAQLATPLHVACRSNHESMVKFLIGCGVEANMQDEHGQTPLLVCCIHGYTALAGLLIESSIAGHLPETLETDTSDHRGLTALNCASIKGDLELVKILLSRGQADVNQTSPKGCSPLIYAGRGGYSEVVRYLLEKRASPLKQDNAGGTVLHHAIEKGHISVLEVMLEHGVDVYSAIELADNAGRTPIFEAIEMEEETNQFGIQVSNGNAEDDNKIGNLIKILTKPKRRQDGGFGAKVNVLNYNGQTPLFSAVKAGNFAAIKTLVEMGASVDLNNGELVKEEEQAEATDEDYESVQEKCFMEAFMNCMTPLHLAATLGYDEIALYLIENGAEVNLQSNHKRYTPLHMAVLTNKPEMLIELLTKSSADPLLEDGQGRTLLDLIYAYNPSYVESFQALLENLQVHRMKTAGEQETAVKATIATHFVNPDDERAIQGAADAEIDGMYEREETKVPDGGLVRDPSNQLLKKGFEQFEEEDIQIDDEGVLHGRVEACFGRKLALGLIAADWKIKEMAIKVMTKRLEKLLAKADTSTALVEVVEACSAAVGQTAREKVMKVFNVSLHMLNLMISSSKVDQDPASIAMFLQMITEEEVVPKLLLKSEESNTRLTNKIHETLLDLSYHPKIGEDLVALAILQRVEQHHTLKASNHKGLLAQLALLFKFINSFGIEVPQKGQQSASNEGSGQALKVGSVLQAAVPAIAHTNQDVKNAAIKIVLDVQRLTGLVKDHHLQQLPEKTREMIKEKVFSVECEAEMNQTSQRKSNVMTAASKGGEALAAMLAAGQSLNVVNIGDSAFGEKVEVDMTMAQENFDKNRAIIVEKGQHKDWQQRELALNAMFECFETTPSKIIKENQEFLNTCTIILKNCLEENNIQIYLVGVQTASVFFQKSINCETVMESLPGLLRAIILHTTDTNTRVRKKSIDLVNQIWDSNGPSNAVAVMKSGQKQKDHDQISLLIAQVLCDAQLHEKAIVGRISLFIKKSMMIESGEELTKRAFKMVIGKDYEEMTEFACQWCMHKNTKVRQCALKLIVEICRLNYIDPRGQPFKQRIINFILGLRPSLRDPLVAKINEVCAQEQIGQIEGQDEPKSSGEPFINVSEMELNIATKGRAASMDVRRGMRREVNPGQANLPQIPGQNNAGAPSLPGLAAVSGAPGQVPTIVLPHSEPLNEAQRNQAEPFLEVFGEELMTCFYSQTWSTRAAAIAKIEEQLHNLDPRRRDAMYGEMNRSNLPPELTIKVFLQLISEGYKDPNLKNYLSLLELVQRALPIYFRYLQPDQVKMELVPLVKNTISKTSDLKAKVREASINFCLYLSHQSPIGPQVMINQVVEELNRAFRPQTQSSASTANSHTGASTSSFGSSNMIASCMKLMNEFQQQTKMVDSIDSELFIKYMYCINEALRHTNPTVRKQGEALFKILYLEFGEAIVHKLISQKPQLVQKIHNESKQEANQRDQASQPGGGGGAMDANATATSFGMSQQERALADQQRALTQLSDNFASMPSIIALVDQKEDLLKELRMPNSKKRLKAIVEIKKIIQKRMATISSAAARDLVEPMQILLRELLKDDNTDVYLEALNLLKFIVGSLATHMSALDLHLMMGQFISLTVTNASSANMRIRVASDKVIIFFAKHSNIGSYIVAKEVLKNIERTNRALTIQPPASMSASEAQAEQTQKKEILVRHYNILHMLLQQFSIVLCYQPDFYVQCLGHIAETLNMPKIDEEPAIKSISTQIIVSLHGIDNELLESGVNKLDFTKKAPIRKFMIEHENLSQKNRNLQVITNPTIMSHNGPTHGPNFIANAADRDDSPKQSMRDTQQSFTSFNRSNHGDVPESPAMGTRMRRSQQDFGQTDTSQSWNRQSSEMRSSRRQGEFGGMPRQDTMQMTGQSWADRRAAQLAEQNGAGSGMLPDIGGHVRRPQMGESFQSMGRMTGAAGFKRDSTAAGSSTGFNYGGGPAAGNTQTSTFGLNQPTDDMKLAGAAGGFKPASPMRSARRQSFSNRMAGAGGSDAVTASIDKDNRPPKYVPTKREPLGSDRVRDSMNSSGMPPRAQNNYQPKTSFGYMPSAQEQQQSSLFARQNSRGSSGSRYQPSAAGAAAASSSGPSHYSAMGRGYTQQSSSVTSPPVQSPAMMKPPVMPPAGPPKPKAMAPPVATFQTKTFDYQDANKKGGNGNGPDLMM